MESIVRRSPTRSGGSFGDWPFGARAWTLSQLDRLSRGQDLRTRSVAASAAVHNRVADLAVTATPVPPQRRSRSTAPGSPTGCPTVDSGAQCRHMHPDLRTSDRRPLTTSTLNCLRHSFCHPDPRRPWCSRAASLRRPSDAAYPRRHPCAGLSCVCLSLLFFERVHAFSNGKWDLPGHSLRAQTPPRRHAGGSSSRFFRASSSPVRLPGPRSGPSVCRVWTISVTPVGMLVTSGLRPGSLGGERDRRPGGLRGRRCATSRAPRISDCYHHDIASV